MTPDIRFIPHAAQAEPGQLAVHGLGNGNGDGGLANAGRAHQTQNLPLGIGVDLLHSDELQNTLLDLIQTKVFLIQNGTGLRHVGPILGGLVPRHFQTHVQIVADHRGLSAAVGLLGQTIHFLYQFAVDLLRQLQLFDFLGILLDLLVAVIAQLVLQYLHLLPQDHVLLHLRHAGAHLLLQLNLQRDDLHLVGQYLVQQPQTLGGVQLLQNALAVAVPQIDVLGNEVRQTAGIPAIQHSGDKIVGQIGNKLLILAEGHIGLADQRLHAGCHAAGEVLLQQLHVGLQKGLILPQAVDTGPLLALHDHPHAGLRGFEDLQNAADRAHRIKILLRGSRGGDLPLRHQKDGAVALHGAVQRVDGDLPLHVKAQRQVGKNCQAPQGNDRNIHRRSFFHKGSPFCRGIVLFFQNREKSAEGEAAPLPCSCFKRPVRRISSPAAFRSLILPAARHAPDHG